LILNSFQDFPLPQFIENKGDSEKVIQFQSFMASDIHRAIVLEFSITTSSPYFQYSDSSKFIGIGERGFRAFD